MPALVRRPCANHGHCIHCQWPPRPRRGRAAASQPSRSPSDPSAKKCQVTSGVLPTCPRPAEHFDVRLRARVWPQASHSRRGRDVGGPRQVTSGVLPTCPRPAEHCSVRLRARVWPQASHSRRGWDVGGPRGYCNIRARSETPRRGLALL